MLRDYRYRTFGRPWDTVTDIERIEASGMYVSFIDERGLPKLVLHHTQAQQIEPAPKD